MSAHLRVIHDDDLGTVAAAVDDEGRIVATASSHVEHGIYVAVDEASVFKATGSLLPLPLWDAATEDPA